MSKSNKIYIIFLAIIINVAVLLISSENSFAENGFFRLFNYKYGFNDKSINSIVKDKHGIIWLGTESGLVKFDGSSFCNIAPNIKKYISSEIRSIKISENKLYLIYKDIGCLTYDLNSFVFQEVISENIADLEPITDHIFYVLTRNGSLFQYVGSTKYNIKKFNNTDKNGQIVCFDNKLYLINFDGLYKFNISNNKLISFNVKFKYNYKFNFCKSNEFLHFISYNSVYKLDSVRNLSNNIIPIRLDIPEKVTYYQYINKSNYFYIYNFKKIVRGEIQPDDDIRTIYSLNLFNNLQLKNLCRYDVNNLLIGTNQGLLWISKYSGKIIHLNDNELFDSIVRVRRSILELNKNELLFFGYPSLVKYDIKKNKYQLKINSSTFYNSILVNNKIYCTTNDEGFVQLNSDYNSYKKLYYKNGVNNQYVGLCYDSLNKKILIGGKNKLIIYDPFNEKNNFHEIVYNCGTIKVIICDYKNSIYWLGTENGLLGINKSGKIIHYLNVKNTKVKISNNKITDLLLVKHNTELWIANNSGVDIFNLRTFSSTKPLPIHSEIISNTVSLELDNLNRVWIATYQGLLLINPYTYNLQHFDKEIHLINNEYNFTSSLKLNNGKVILGGLNGYDIINPKEFEVKFRKNLIALSTIFRISKDDTVQCNFSNNIIQFNSDNEYLKIYVHNNNIIKDLNYDYEYAIDNNPWVKTNSLAQILITDLLPGKHILKIRPLDNLLSTSQIIELTIISKIPFYKSSLFAEIIIGLLLSTIVLYFIAIRKVIAIKNKTKAQIAMDLHDEVGTVLTKALFYTKNKNDIQLSNLLETALNSLRAYIYTMSKKDIQLIDLADDFREMMNFVAISGNINLDFNVEDLTDKRISSMLFRDLKLTLYEITTNIQKHSFCKFIEANLSISENNLRIIITEDGVLTDLDKIYYKGNGIENMQKRIKAHRGTIIFQLNKFTTGLTIEINVPLK